MGQLAIKVEDAWKQYVLGGANPHYRTFYDMLSNSLQSPLRRFRKLGGHAEEVERFWALAEVNFAVQPGEVVGVIGSNGAGKSTLLKLLSRITAPTRGRIEIRGRLASLLEVGTGFHPELSGRENIFLNGAILGMTRREVVRKFDEIVAFAEVEKFVDTPVKRYSSGMYVRLAFAVAAHLEADVLLVDEVLAVGDASFQRKSLGKMSGLAKGGRTVLFVSHNLGAIRNLCTRALVFHSGHLTFDGAVEEGAALYENTFSSPGGSLRNGSFYGPLSDVLRFDQFACKQAGAIVNFIDPLRDFQIELSGVALKPFLTLDLKIALFRNGVHIASCHDTPPRAELREGRFMSRFEIPADVFRPGRYTVGVGVNSGIGSWLWGADVAVLDFSDKLSHSAPEVDGGIISIPYKSERIQ